jgi:hypothetical protein
VAPLQVLSSAAALVLLPAQRLEELQVRSRQQGGGKKQLSTGDRGSSM